MTPEDNYPPPSLPYRIGRGTQEAVAGMRARSAADLAETHAALAYPFQQVAAGWSGAAPPGVQKDVGPTDVRDHPAYPTQARMEYEATNSPSGKVDTDYYKPGNAQIVEANYGQYKDREAARAAQASQPVNYPGAMSALSMTNARVADGGDADANEQRRINTARAGGAGWLGLFTSGGAQRALNIRRQQDIARGHLGVEQGRLAFDTNKYWQGERPLQEQELGLKERTVGIEGRKQQFEEKKAAADIWTKNRIAALRQSGRLDEAAQLEREHLGRAEDRLVVQGLGGGGTIVTAPGTERETQQWISGMPPDWKPK